MLFVFIVLTLAVIWGHSMMPRSSSAAESGVFVGLLASLWERLSVGADMADHIVRKCAHFTEYTVLGIELGLYRTLAHKAETRPKLVIRTANLGMVAALIDETIQIFSGRGPMVQDVWLDTAGVCFGAVLVSFLYVRRRGEG